MRITIIGGTGDLGRGLALRWAKNHAIILGSRSPEKGAKTAEDYTLVAKQAYMSEFRGSITGTGNPEAAREGEIVVLAVPFESAIENAKPLRSVLRDEQIVVSTVVPMRRVDRAFEYAPFINVDPSTQKVTVRSAAEIIAEELPPAERVVSGLHTMSAKRLGELDKRVECDIIFCGDDPERVARIARLTEEIPGVKAYSAGPLRTSILVESMTPLIINVASHSKKREPLIRIV